MSHIEKESNETIISKNIHFYVSEGTKDMFLAFNSGHSSRRVLSEGAQDADSFQNVNQRQRKIDHDRHTCHLSLQLSLWGTALFAAIRNEPDKVGPSVFAPEKVCGLLPEE